MDSWKNKKVLIMGLGVQGGGLGVARFFVKHGALVTVTDLRDPKDLQKSLTELSILDTITYRLGGHNEEDFITADLIVKGPSIPWTNIYIQEAARRKIPIIMETSFFAQHTKARMIGITGTRGKSTTTSYIYKALKQFYTQGNVYIAGNVPDTCAIELLDTVGTNDIVVLELSSWQLSGFHRGKVSPQIAVFTNIYEDHLNYYENLQKYVYDKTAIFKYQKPEQLCITTEQTVNILTTHNVTIPSRVRITKADDFPGGLKHARGQHNRLNAALALSAVAAILPELSREVIADSIREAGSVRFRQEIVAVFDTVTVVNDSTSTTPISAITAIETFQDKKIALVLGGYSKNLSVNDLIEVIQKHKTNILSITLLKGTMTEEVAPLLTAIPDLHVTSIYEDFNAAIYDSFMVAKRLGKEAYLLFSPGAASFSQFRNEFERGDRFNQVISDIMKK